MDGICVWGSTAKRGGVEAAKKKYEAVANMLDVRRSKYKGRPFYHIPNLKLRFTNSSVKELVDLVAPEHNNAPACGRSRDMFFVVFNTHTDTTKFNTNVYLLDVADLHAFKALVLELSELGRAEAAVLHAANNNIEDFAVRKEQFLARQREQQEQQEQQAAAQVAAAVAAGQDLEQEQQVASVGKKSKKRRAAKEDNSSEASAGDATEGNPTTPPPSNKKRKVRRSILERMAAVAESVVAGAAEVVRAAVKAFGSKGHPFLSYAKHMSEEQKTQLLELFDLQEQVSPPPLVVDEGNIALRLLHLNALLRLAYELKATAQQRVWAVSAFDRCLAEGHVPSMLLAVVVVWIVCKEEAGLIDPRLLREAAVRAHADPFEGVAEGEEPDLLNPVRMAVKKACKLGKKLKLSRLGPTSQQFLQLLLALIQVDDAPVRLRAEALLVVAAVELRRNDIDPAGPSAPLLPSETAAAALTASLQESSVPGAADMVALLHKACGWRTDLLHLLAEELSARFQEKEAANNPVAGGDAIVMEYHRGLALALGQEAPAIEYAPDDMAA